ncbi:hypothetical protein C8R46DRAFT_1123196 [Mycena filopes]|nr:hypothetical protein C8R46DRAFT_1123196 [Mycena filopes]
MYQVPPRFRAGASSHPPLLSSINLAPPGNRVLETNVGTPAVKDVRTAASSHPPLISSINLAAPGTRVLETNVGAPAVKDVVPTRATINEVCRLFLRGRCTYGERCRHNYVRSAPEPEPLELKNSRESRPSPQPSAVRPPPTAYVVRLPKRPLQTGKTQGLHTPPDRFSSETLDFIDLTDDSGDPVVRLRRADYAPENSSQNVYKYNDLSWDEDTNFFGFKADNNSWGNHSLSSDESFTSDSSLNSTTDTLSSLSSAMNPSQTTVSYPPPPPSREICRNWRQNRCWRGYSCAYIHEDLKYDSPKLLPLAVETPVTSQSKHPPPRSREVCRDWLRDQCWFGHNCRYVHRDLEYDSPDPPPPPPLPRDPIPPPPEPHFIITVHDHTTVSIGSGFEIHNVTTSVETPWVILSNIPARVKQQAITQILAPFGTVREVRLPTVPAKDSMTVKARFSNHSQALQASKALDGSNTFNEQRAMEAIAAAKGACDDYYVQALNTLTVKFTHLPPDADAEFMERFGQPEDTMWERPNYPLLAPAVDGMRRFLRGLGGFLELEIRPPPYSHGLIRAWATFSSAAAARSAAGALHGRKPTFTGKTRIFAHHVQSISYTLSPEDYHKDARLIEMLRQAVWRNNEAGMSVVTRRLPAAMMIRLSATGIKELGWLKAEFEKISRGELVRRDGVAVWDFFFGRPAGACYLREVEARERDVRIEADPVRQNLKVFGTPPGRAAVRATILRKMSDLQAMRVRVIRLPGRVVHPFLTTQFSRLCAKFGPENVSVDNWTHLVTLRGGDELYQAGIEAEVIAQPDYRRNAVECPVCFNQVVSPITLRCGHHWCRTCCIRYLLAAIENRRFPLTCLGNEAKCTEPISLSVARSILQPSEFNAIVDASLSSYVHAHAKEFHYCPSPNCLQIYRTGPKGTVVQCPSCLLRICSHCHSEAHDGFACAEQDGGDRLFKEWVKDHDVKNCPGCAIPIERDEGCHHVTCIQCQTHICWVCLQTFPKGEGIYKHMREEHGGIGLNEA